MKKVALSLLGFALAGVVAFAQAAPAPVVGIGMWGRQMTSFGNTDNSDIWGGLGASWGNTPRIVGLNINAHTDTVGFSITPSADNGTFGLTDQNKAWINPFPGVTVEAGLNLETDTWRGTADFGSYDWLRFQGTHGDSVTFNRIGEGGMASAVEYNKDGIGAWVYLQAPTGAEAVTKDALGNGLNYGAAYVIPSIGTIKAQLIGLGVNGGNGASHLVQGAFNLSAVANLYEEVGVVVPTSAINFDYMVSDYLTYTADKAKIHGLVIATGFNSKNASSDLGLEVGAGVDYDLGDGMGLGGDVRYSNKQVSGVAQDMTGVFVGVTKGFSNGLIGIGFEYSTTVLAGQSPAAGATAAVAPSTYSLGSPAVAAQAASDATKAHWAIPIRMEEWF